MKVASNTQKLPKHTNISGPKLLKSYNEFFWNLPNHKGEIKENSVLLASWPLSQNPVAEWPFRFGTTNKMQQVLVVLTHQFSMTCCEQGIMPSF